MRLCARRYVVVDFLTKRKRKKKKDDKDKEAECVVNLCMCVCVLIKLFHGRVMNGFN